MRLAQSSRDGAILDAGADIEHPADTSRFNGVIAGIGAGCSGLRPSLTRLRQPSAAGDRWQQEQRDPVCVDQSEAYA